MSAETPGAHIDEDSLPLLQAPESGIPEVIVTADALATAARSLASGEGPIAIDAERASGFRYGQRAFLIQLHREGAGTILVDPEALDDLSPLAAALADAEWVLHSATQDLPCLAERDIVPSTLFDTEMAARLLGWERFGLGAVVARTLGVRLAKAHSAADWSTRPLPESWLAYAVLDVDLLLGVRDHLVDALEDAGKTAWAAEEFAHLSRFTPTAHEEPWRRVNGVGKLRSRRQMAVARELWELRDTRARERDQAPGRLLSDRSLVGIAGDVPQSSTDLQRHRSLRRPLPLSEAKSWYAAVRRANALPESELPTRHPEGPRRPRRTPEQRDLIASRHQELKAGIRARAEELQMGPEVLIKPRIITELAGEIEEPVDLASYLAEREARPWQIAQVVPVLERVLADF